MSHTAAPAIRVECPSCNHPMNPTDALCCSCGELLPAWVLTELRNTMPPPPPPDDDADA